MSTGNPLGTNDAPFLAGGTIVQYSCVKLNTTNNTVVACTAITDAPDGIAQTAAVSGDQVTVRTIAGSISKVRLGGTVTSGVAVMVKGSGTGEVDTAAGATAHTVGTLKTGGVSGDIVEIIFKPALKSPANA